MALVREHSSDPQILACLGRVWYLRGKQDRNLQSMKTALDYARSAMDAAPDQPYFRFNVAFVQMQIAQLVNSIPDATRTSVDVETANSGLDTAIETLIELSKLPNPPFPKHDLEQRANMGRNTMRRQLERAMQSQKEYESKNAARLDEARKQREAEMQKREEQKHAAEERAEEQKEKLREERKRMMEEDRAIAEQKREDERVREEAELTTDEETGEKRKRQKKKPTKRKKKGDESDTDIDGTDDEVSGRKSRGRSTSATPASGEDGEQRPKKKKRRKLERKPKAASKFKSDEKVVESDSDDEAVAAQQENAALAEKVRKASEAGGESSPLADTAMADGDSAEEQTVDRSRKKKPARILDDEDEEDEDEPATATNRPEEFSMVNDGGPSAGNENAMDG